MADQSYPPGWDAERLKRLLAHYEEQSDEEAVVEDEIAFADPAQTFMEVPNELVPVVRELIARHQS